jgi:hypothetical protein
MPKTSTTFAEALLQTARDHIRKYQAEDTMAIGRYMFVHNLMRQLSAHPFAPKGTNATFYFVEAFACMVKENPDVKEFILD